MSAGRTSEDENWDDPFARGAVAAACVSVYGGADGADVLSWRRRSGGSVGQWPSQTLAGISVIYRR